MISYRHVVAAAVILLTPLSFTAPAQRDATNGFDVLRQMRDAYTGRWYASLTFTQKTRVPSSVGGNDPSSRHWTDESALP